jgi:hypothetical protein
MSTTPRWSKEDYDKVKNLALQRLNERPPVELAQEEVAVRSALPPEEFDRNREMQRLLDPLRILTQSFFNRTSELDALRAYVGVLPAASVSVRLRQAFRPVWRAPFLVYGLGGAGKTTLIARFILEITTREA